MLAMCRMTMFERFGETSAGFVVRNRRISEYRRFCGRANKKTAGHPGFSQCWKQKWASMTKTAGCRLLATPPPEFCQFVRIHTP